MCTNGTCLSPDSSFQPPCSLDGVRTNRNSASYVVPIAIIVAVLSLVAVAANALVLAAIWKNPTLRTPSYVILCGLAFTDLCNGLITEPLFLAFEMICLEEGKDINELSLRVYIPTECCVVYFTKLTLILITLISIERWLHMSRRSLLTVRRSCFIVAVVCLLIIPLTTFQVTRIKREEFISIAILSTILILCVIATSISYFKVFKIIRRHQQQVQANKFSQNSAQPAIDILKYKKSVFSLLYILGIFYVSYLSFLVILGLSLSNNEFPMGYPIGILFLFLSSSLNPVIYIWRMNDIRTGVKHLLKKLICKT